MATKMQKMFSNFSEKSFFLSRRFLDATSSQPYSIYNTVAISKGRGRSKTSKHRRDAQTEQKRQQKLQQKSQQKSQQKITTISTNLSTKKFTNKNKRPNKSVNKSPNKNLNKSQQKSRQKIPTKIFIRQNPYYSR